MEEAAKKSRYDIEVVSRCVEEILPERQSGVGPGTYVKVKTTLTAIVRGAKLQHERPAPPTAVSVIRDNRQIPVVPPHTPSSPVQYYVRETYDAKWNKVGQLLQNEQGYLSLAGTVSLLELGDHLMVV
jgi:hypothetical protein